MLSYLIFLLPDMLISYVFVGRRFVYLNDFLSFHSAQSFRFRLRCTFIPSLSLHHACTNWLNSLVLNYAIVSIRTPKIGELCEWTPTCIFPPEVTVN